MSSEVTGVKALYELEAKDYWLVDAAQSLKTECVGTIARTILPSGFGKTVFMIRVTSRAPKPSPRSIINFFSEIKGTKTLGKAITENELVVFGMQAPKKDGLASILAEVPGRISLYTDCTERLRVLIETPGIFNAFETREPFMKIGKRMDALPRFRLLHAPKIERTGLPFAEFIDTHVEPAPSPTFLTQLDERDVNIAMELFRSGYYDPNNKHKKRLEDIAKQVKLSKPTLIRRKKRMEAMGIETILSPRISDEDRKAAAAALEGIVKWKKKTA